MFSNLAYPRLFSRSPPLSCLSKRYKTKRRNQAGTTKDPTQLALEHFDKFYSPVYGKQWPSMRIALLSHQKYCALVNNYANAEETCLNLISDGADDILKLVRELETKTSEHAKTSYDEMSDASLTTASITETVLTDNDISIIQSKQADLHNFTPTKKISSEIEQMKEEETKQYDYEASSAVEVDIIDDQPLCIPHYLRAFTYERGNVSFFEEPRRDASGRTDCYLYDASSLLPVLALDLFPDCSVLDLCAAPGGKSLTMLQTLLPASLTCVDSSYSRLQRLKNVLKQYVPGKHAVGELVSLVCHDGSQFCSKFHHNPPFDRVLVDVPCNTDRHVLGEPENNLFRPSRLRERLDMRKIQMELLYNGILACKPGGTIVYSTCTLSPIQNDGVIQATLEKLWQNSNAKVAVVNTNHIAETFRETYNFYTDCRYGQLVLPNLTANFGPMYFCKLMRIN